MRLDPAREAEPESELLLRREGGCPDRTGAEDAGHGSDAAVLAWTRIENQLVDLAPWVPLFTPWSGDFLSKRVGNYQHHPPGGGFSSISCGSLRRFAEGQGAPTAADRGTARQRPKRHPDVPRRHTRGLRNVRKSGSRRPGTLRYRVARFIPDRLSRTTGARLNQMELNGALSNPRAVLELSRLNTVYAGLIANSMTAPRSPRPLPPSSPPLLAAVAHVLGVTHGPLPVGEIHRAAEEFAGQPLLRNSVKAALAAGTAGQRPRFRRIRHGVYQSAHDR